jgi:hypothetical protein
MHSRLDGPVLDRVRRPTEGIDLLGKIVGVEKGLFFLVVETVWESGVGRARVAYGREVELAQFALPRQQTTPNKPDPMGFLVNVIQPKNHWKIRKEKV